MKDIIGILVCRLFWMVSSIPAVLIFPIQIMVYFLIYLRLFKLVCQYFLIPSL